jgi:hypothetical protein
MHGSLVGRPSLRAFWSMRNNAGIPVEVKGV